MSRNEISTGVKKIKLINYSNAENKKVKSKNNYVQSIFKREVAIYLNVRKNELLHEFKTEEKGTINRDNMRKEDM